MRRSCVLGFALALLQAPAALASSAEITGRDIVVRDSAAQHNVLVLTDRVDGFIVVTDAAGLTAGAGCVASPTGEVACPTQRIDRVVVRGGAGNDDILTRFALLAVISGEGGDDKVKIDAPYSAARLAGVNGPVATSPNVVDGGTGNDRLEGWLGDDNLNGGDGDDELRGYGGTNVYSGGAGSDTVSYADFTTAVTANLDGQPGDGPLPSRRDTIKADNENLVGSQANDTLTGNAGANRIDGLAGNDQLSGLEGNDSLSGGAGNDSLSGGAGSDAHDGGDGADTVLAEDGEIDTVACGTGQDTAHVDTSDALASDCETLCRHAVPESAASRSAKSQRRAGVRRGAKKHRTVKPANNRKRSRS